MIVVYPMLISKNVPSNVLPGISKVLEKYTLTYQLDDIIRNAGRLSRGQLLVRTGGQLKLSENKAVLEQGKGGLDIMYDPTPVKSQSPEKATVKVDMPSFNALSLEPTWIKIDTQIGTSMIGIKVVPFPIVSDENLINLITSDFYKDWFPAKLSSLGRGVVRLTWATLRKIPFLKKLAPSVSGDPLQDIVFAKTTHADHVFLILNSMDIGSDFFERTSRIKQLYSLGWSSFVVTDNVNKRAFFCMKEFHGMCSSVQYNFMYNTIGREHGKVFEDLEDVKKSSSPFFKLTTKSSKVMAEQYVVNKINKFYKFKIYIFLS
jgi:hypothetical protein